MEAGKKRLAGDTLREANTSEVSSIRSENDQLKQLASELMLKNRLLKKVWVSLVFIAAPSTVGITDTEKRV